MTAVQVERDTLHRWALQQLPFELNGTIAGVDAELLRAHLVDCPDCSSQLERERRWATAMQNGATVQYTPHASLGKLLNRIDSAARHTTMPHPAPRLQRQFPRPRFLIAAAIALSALALGLTLFFTHDAIERSPATGYRTAADPVTEPGGGPYARIVFAEEATAGSLREVLRAAGARIIDGPSTAGAYLVAGRDPVQSAEQLAATLRNQQGVVFAEPVDAQ